MLSVLRKRSGRSTDLWTRKNRTSSTRLQLESLSDRVLMSATPLTYTTAPLKGSHTVILSVENNVIEIIDNGKVAMTRAVAETSSITLNGGKGTQSLFEIFKTPAGISTTVNLAGSDGIFVGDITSDYNPFSSLPMTPGTLTEFSKTPVLSNSPGVRGIQGNLTINGSQNTMIVDDSSGTVRKNITVNDSGVAGLAPAAINYSNIRKLSVYGASDLPLSTLGNRYSLVGGPSRIELYSRSRYDTVNVANTSGVVIAHGAGGQITLNASGTDNKFDAAPRDATLTGDATAYYQHAIGFKTIRANASSSTDEVHFDSAESGMNTLTASPANAILSGSNYSNEAYGFNTVTATGKSTSDVANLTGSSTVANSLNADDDTVTLSGSGYTIQISNFEKTDTVNTTSNSTAYFFDKPAEPNAFFANPASATMEGANYANTARGFRYVTADSRSKDTYAVLQTDSTGGATLNATPDYTTLTGANYFISLDEFDNVYAFSLSQSDHADFRDAGFWTATPTSATINYGNEIVTANNFASVTDHQIVTAGQIVPVTLTAAGTLTKGTLSQFTLVLDTGVELAAVNGSQYVWNLTAERERYFGPNSAAYNSEVQFFRALIDPNVQRAAFMGLVRDDALTHDDMRDMFVAGMTSGAVAAGTMSDFIYIADNMVGVLGASAALKGVTDRVVFPSSANIYMYTLDASGHSDRVPMGNLSATYSSAVLGKLVDVWFNGVAYPETPVEYKPITLSSASSSGASLFGSAGKPVFTHVDQGNLGDCWLMAPLAEVAAQKPDLITSMFTFAGTRINNGKMVEVYTVRFFNEDKEPVYVTVDTLLPDGGNTYARLSGEAFWVALAEKAYVVASGLGWVKPGDVGDYRYEALDGAYADWALNALSPEDAELVLGKDPWSTFPAPNPIAFDFSDIGEFFNEGKFVVLCTPIWPSDPSIFGLHCYALVGYDPSSATPYKLYNPHGGSNAIIDRDLAFLYQNFLRIGYGGAASTSASEPGVVENVTPVAPNATAPTAAVSDDALSALSDGVAIFLAPETSDVNRKTK